MRGKTIVVLVVVTLAGFGAAWLFRQDAEKSPATSATDNEQQTARIPQTAKPQKTDLASSGTGRGQIVPLAVGEGFSGTAFIGLRQREPAADASPNPRESRLWNVPTIRGDGQPPDRAAGDGHSPAPHLDGEFPAAIGLLGIAPQRGKPSHAERSGEARATASSVVPAHELPAESLEKESGLGAPEFPSPAPRQAAKPVTHTIVDGDTLPRLAERYLGDAQRADEIFEANRQRLPSPQLLPIGVKIVIPVNRP